MTVELRSEPPPASSPGRAVAESSYPVSPASFTFPNRVLFGCGTRGSLAAELARLGVSRPLVVTDPGLIASGLVEEVIGPIDSAVLFHGVHANPTEDDVLAGLAAYLDRRLRRPRRPGWGQPDRRRQGHPADGDPSGPACRLRPDRRGDSSGSRPISLRWSPSPRPPAPAARPGEAP